MKTRAILGGLSAALLLSACASADPAACESATPGGRSFATRVSVLPIENVGGIAPGLYRGAQPCVEGFAALKAAGFRSVIDLQEDHSERAEAEAAGLRIYEIPMHAAIGSTAPTQEQIDRFLDIVCDPANRPVYFHCRRGKDRTGTMAALYRIEVDGWSNDEAVAEMLAYGYSTWYRDLIDCVRSYAPRRREALAQAALACAGCAVDFPAAGSGALAAGHVISERSEAPVPAAAPAVSAAEPAVTGAAGAASN